MFNTTIFLALILFILVLFIVLLVLFNTLPTPSIEYTLGEASFTEFIRVNPHFGKSVYHFVSTFGTTTEDAYLIVYYSPNGIDQMFGINQFSGKLFTISAIKNPSNVDQILLTFTNRITSPLTINETEIYYPL